MLPGWQPLASALCPAAAAEGGRPSTHLPGAGGRGCPAAGPQLSPALGTGGRIRNFRWGQETNSTCLGDLKACSGDKSGLELQVFYSLAVGLGAGPSLALRGPRLLNDSTSPWQVLVKLRDNTWCNVPGTVLGTEPRNYSGNPNSASVSSSIDCLLIGFIFSDGEGGAQRVSASRPRFRRMPGREPGFCSVLCTVRLRITWQLARNAKS